MVIRPFDHERMPVYRLTLRLVARCDDHCRRLRSRTPDLANQIERAASSIALNIAEGASEYSKGEKVRFYRMAKRSAGECAGAFEVLTRKRLLRPDEILPDLHLTRRIAAQLTRLILAVEERNRRPIR